MSRVVTAPLDTASTTARIDARLLACGIWLVAIRAGRSLIDASPLWSLVEGCGAPCYAVDCVTNFEEGIVYIPILLTLRQFVRERERVFGKSDFIRQTAKCRLGSQTGPKSGLQLGVIE